MMREIEKPKEERPDFNFGLRPRLIQAGQEFKLICCVQCTPTPKVEYIYCKCITFGDVFFLAPLAVDIPMPNQVHR